MVAQSPDGDFKERQNDDPVNGPANAPGSHGDQGDGGENQKQTRERIVHRAKVRIPRMARLAMNVDHRAEGDHTQAEGNRQRPQTPPGNLAALPDELDQIRKRVTR